MNPGTRGLAELKAYMHVDHDEDDALIESIFNAQSSYLRKNGIDPESDEGWLAAAGLTLQIYDGTPLQPGIQTLINSLKLDTPAF